MVAGSALVISEGRRKVRAPEGGVLANGQGG